MGSKTKIEWCDATWSPIRVRVKPDAAQIARDKGYISLIPIAEKMAGHIGPHCEHVSPGCENCYADTNNHRCLPGNGTGLPYDRRSRDLVDAFVDEKMLLQPLKWKAPRKIFVENQSDLFGEWVTDEMLDRSFAVMALCPQHTFQVLTKRPERMHEYFSADNPRYTARKIVDAAAEMGISGHVFDCDIYFPLMNVWLGVSVENQAVKNRIDILRQVCAAIRFLSLEPLLANLGDLDLTGISWAIAGGESGPGARPCDPEWVWSIVQQCRTANVPCFVKQLGSQHAAPGDSKGGDMLWWPEHLRVRQFPVTA